MIQVVSFAFLVVFLSLILRQKDGGIHFLLLTAGTLFLFSFAYNELTSLYGNIESFLENSPVIQTYMKPFLKIMGVTYLADFGSSICKDAGYQTLGKQVEIIGKIFILAITIPLLLTVVDTVFDLL